MRVSRNAFDTASNSVVSVLSNLGGFRIAVSCEMNGVFVQSTTVGAGMAANNCSFPSNDNVDIVSDARLAVCRGMKILAFSAMLSNKGCSRVPFLFISLLPASHRSSYQGPIMFDQRSISLTSMST
jgi:hypothetical protein